MSKIIERMLKFMESEHINDNQMTVAAGLSNGTIGKARSGVTKSLNSDNIEKILNAYPVLSPEWLLTGRGEMLKQNVPSVATSGTGAADEQPSSGGKDTKNNPNNPKKAIPFTVATQQNLKPIPLVAQAVAAGFGNENFSIAESDVKEYYVIPKFRHCHIDFMIEVTGDSMTPHLNSGDIIACTIVRDSHFIQWNKCHVIATVEQGLLVKRLMPGTDGDHLKAVSDNTSYPAFDIPKDEITGLALVIGSVCLE